MTWTFPDQPAGATGTVTLTVSVNADALNAWSYSTVNDGAKVLEGAAGPGQDFMIYDRAKVSALAPGAANPVSGLTQIIPNPVDAKIPGSLVVTKIVNGDLAESDRDFHFTVALSGEGSAITGVYGDMSFTGGVASFTLKGGESKSASKLPDGVRYTVTEAEANTDGYTTTAQGAEGTISSGSQSTAIYVNYKGTAPAPEIKTGTLMIFKAVTGTGDISKEFHFTITLEDTTFSGTLGGVTFTGGVGSATVKHGQLLTIPGLPEGGYTVTEAEANADGYTTTFWGDRGVIVANSSAAAVFINHKGEDVPEQPPETTAPTPTATPGPTATPVPTPGTGPVKTETDPGDGKAVLVGQLITYQIHWKNYQEVPAAVTVRDPLSAGLEFVSAAGGVYDTSDRTVVWTLGEQSPGAEGDVTLVARVTEQAAGSGGVTNQALVQVGTDPEQSTNTTVNPLPGVTPTPVVTGGTGSPVPETGDDTPVGLWLAVLGLSLLGTGLAASALLRRRKRDR